MYRAGWERPIWAWLILVLWVEMIAVLVLRAYCLEKHPTDPWWVMVSSVHFLLLGAGVAYWWFRIYGVVLGLSIAALAWCVLQG